MSEKSKGHGRSAKNPHLGPRMNIMFRLNRDVRARVLVLAEADGRSLSEMLERIVNLHFEAVDMRTIVREEITSAIRGALPASPYGRPPSVADCIDYINRVGVENIPVLPAKRDH